MISLRKLSDIFFFTATNLQWKKLLAEDIHKQIITDSLRFLVKEGRIKVTGFVIMPNHIHLIWQILKPFKKSDVQRDFLKYTAQQIRFEMIKNNSLLLDQIVVNSKDRKTQIWERKALSFELDNTQTLLQKLNYIHNNPLQEKWKLVNLQEEYAFSSAGFYLKEDKKFDFITHFSEIM